jgi:hypothetical protein
MTMWRELDVRMAAGGFAAEVRSCEAASVWLSREGVALEARVALGCVYQPEPGDTVLVLQADETLWVVALLTRTSGAPLRMLAPGGLTVETDAALRVSAPRASFLIAEVQHAGRSLMAQLERLDITAGLSRLVADLSLLIAGNAVRQVEGLDQVRAGSIEQTAQKDLQMTAENTFLAASNLVRVDAEQVHIG